MSSFLHLVAGIIKIGMILSVSGGIYKATSYLQKEAFASTQHGLISLGRLNRQLNGPRKIKVYPKNTL